MSNIATAFGMDLALKKLGLQELNNGTSTGTENFGSGETISSHTPVDGALIGKVRTTSPEDYQRVMEAATAAFKEWRTVPAPRRGDIVRQFGNRLRELKEPLGKLVSYEMGKSYQEGLGPREKSPAREDSRNSPL